jgi:hypothetical protein
MTVHTQRGHYAAPHQAPPVQPNEPDDPAAQVAASAKGWHSLQMAVLGFIGICGMLRDGTGPSWLQWLAAALVLLGLLFAAVAIYLVGRVAYPFYGGPMAMATRQQVHAAGDRLRRGIRMTFVSVATVAIATVSGWWPSTATPAAPGGAAGAAVSMEVRDRDGGRQCGQMVDSPDGTVQLTTVDGTVQVRLEQVASIRPVRAC